MLIKQTKIKKKKMKYYNQEKNMVIIVCQKRKT